MSDDLEEDFLDDLDPSIFGAQYEEIAPPPRTSHTHHKVDHENLKTYIYPTNLQVRDYQYNIVNRALFHNVLVALPTGLGKTFIASTVMLNFLRWFPDLKLIFMAPTRPLVAQQIKACCGITGIPSSKVAILLDKTRKNRGAIWDEKLVFFTTPQVVENDLATGLVDPKLVVLLVIDEAHRAKGNYAYNNVVKFLNRFNSSYRILALTATPASTVEGVQEIVDNLNISKVEVRTERSIDIFRYLKRKTVERFNVDNLSEITEVIELLCEAIAPVLKTANQRKILEITDPAKINAFAALEAQQKLIRDRNIPEGLKWANYFILQLLIVVGQCLRRLNTLGIRSFYSYFLEKHTEFSAKYNNKKSTNHLAASFYFHQSTKAVLARCQDLVKDPTFLGHGKLEITISELDNFFKFSANPDSRVIIFTELREAALDIVRALEQQKSHSKPHIFIGQAKEREKFSEDKFLKKGKKKGKKLQENEDIVVPSIQERPLSSSEQAQMHGMNQKMQKDLIKKFKAGEYNVLVATSIGEEGLDIGEVDLIICYDSTSSPIKNIQRMGRTGRNRDGKVLLLFSSNEELKFDKAMGGYEYIQNHIRNGNLITLHDQIRIIPENCTPAVVEELIEIPEENMDIRAEEDEDEIIKLATKYMTGTKSGKAKANPKAKNSKAEKIQKKFFMPDDVDTGFKLVSMMLKRTNEDISVGEKKQQEKRQKTQEVPKDILDTILDSDDDNELIQLEKAVTCDPVPPVLEVLLPSKADMIPSLSTLSGEPSAPELHPKGLPKEPSVSPSKTLGLRRPELNNILRKSPRVLKQPSIFDVPIRTRAGLLKPSLGVKKRPPSVLEQLRNVQPKKLLNATSVSNDELDEFDDDEDEILALARSTSSFEFQSQSSGNRQMAAKTYDPKLFPIPLGEEGLLTREETNELYMSYYMPTEAYSLVDCYRVNALGDGDYMSGTNSTRFMEFHEFQRRTDPEKARNIIGKYQAVLDDEQSTLGDFVYFE